MDANVKQKWLEALRSGKYKQGSAFLHPKADEFCCLGVLCDVIDNKGWQGYDSTDIYTYVGPHKHKSNSYVPSDLSDSIGLSINAQTQLSRMNDDGHSFSIIADYIEGNL
jgi:hypothetical protein